MRLAWKKAQYVFWAILYALGIYVITMNIFVEIAEENAFIATIANFIMIFVIVVAEKIEVYYLSESAKRTKSRAAKKILYIYHSGPSFKSAMYFFYIVVLIYSALNYANPNFYLGIPYEYLVSVRYGALVLITSDKFMEQIFKDIKSDYRNYSGRENEKN
jgi:hypothetical protein